MNDTPMQSGDVILMLSTGPVSALIAWCGDSIYSHSALMADNGDLIEASAGGVRRYPLAKRLEDRANVVFVDGYRSLDAGGEPLNALQRSAIVTAGEKFIGIPYEFGKLLDIGIICAVRQKLPAHPMARFLVREALDHALENNNKAMTCSEFVYNSFLGAGVTPAGSVTPVIVVAPRSELPFPKIDWVAFAKEMWELLHAAKPQSASVYASADLSTLGTDIQDDDLNSRITQLRGKLGMDAVSTAQHQTTGEIIIANPNPKLVTPLDLATTPSHLPLGRLIDYSQ